MARRADHTREALKELAIDAGWELIKEGGFARFSARKVATQIGYTVGTIYNIFGTHDLLILHINARTLDAWYDAMERGYEQTPYADPLYFLANFYIDYSRSHYNQWSALFDHHVTDSAAVPEWYHAKMMRFFELVESMLQPILNHDTIKATRAARILWAGMHGIATLSHSGKLDTVGGESAEILAVSFMNDYIAGVKSS